MPNQLSNTASRKESGTSFPTAARKSKQKVASRNRKTQVLASPQLSDIASIKESGTNLTTATCKIKAASLSRRAQSLVSHKLSDSTSRKDSVINLIRFKIVSDPNLGNELSSLRHEGGVTINCRSLMCVFHKCNHNSAV